MTPEELKLLIVKLLEDKKAENINVIDLQNATSLTRFMVFANGRSSKNIGAMAEYIADELKAAGHSHTSTEGLGQKEWVLVDAGDVIVNIFEAEARERYKLDEFWGEKR
jgi:ribosome-associated protein